MDFTQLRYFQTVAHTGNVTRAAAELYVTQPNISKRISSLEEELGVPLFDHRKGKILLNDYGRMFLSSVDIAFAELNSGVQNIQRMYDASKYVLSLGCNIRGYLGDHLPAFSTMHPEIGIRQLDCSTQQLIDHLVDRSINLAISNEPLDDERIDFKLLGSKKYVVALHKDHPLSKYPELSFSQLKDETFICDTSRFHLDNLKAECQKHGYSPQVGYEIQSSELVFGLVDAKRGVAIVPIVMACHMIATHPDSNVRICGISDPLPAVIIGVGTRKNQTSTMACDTFLNFLSECLIGEEDIVQDAGYGHLL